MQPSKRIISLALVLALCISIFGCSAQPETQNQLSRPGFSQKRPTTPTVPQPDHEPEETVPATQATSPVLFPENLDVSSTIPTEAPQREDLYEIIDLVGGGSIEEEDISDLTEEELTDMIGDLLENSTAQNPNLDSSAGVSGTIDAGNTTEEGMLEQPFDQLYPELMDKVEFSGESVTVKLDNSCGGELTDAMRQAGVAQLQLLYDLGEASWYEAKLAAGTNTNAVVSELRNLDEVLCADFIYTGQAHRLGQPHNIHEHMHGNERVNEQWYLKHFGIMEGHQAMTNPGGKNTVVVAVIDTGVDITHTDLSANIWTNPNGEIPDNGLDDDGNGYIDDYNGYNFVSGNGNVSDDNGHGTHVAGIIAAQNNNLGTVGIAYNVKIMPIKALNHEGVTNDTDIINAVKYAMENGAEIINMSFGQQAMGLAAQEILAAAYEQCVLVASAGNDGAPNEGEKAIPNYPAALPYVLGVMSVDEEGKESTFSSYDVTPFNGIEYEVYAPGQSMLSTIPGNRYASWSGTSMAAPVVSAIAALLRSQYSDHSKYSTKFIYGQITATSELLAECCEGHQDHNHKPIVNLKDALSKLPQPDIGLSSYDLFDTKQLQDNLLNNGDGVLDTGETVALGLTLRNRWGESGKTTVTISAGNDPYVTIANPTVEYGNIGTYSTADCGKIIEGDLLVGWEDPFYITVAEECPGDHVIHLDVTISATNGLNPEDTSTYTTNATIGLQVRNGSLLPTVIDEDMTLKSGNLYIVYNATTINAGVTVTVEPGAQLQFWSSDREDPYADEYMPSLRVYGKLLVEGTKEKPVQIFPGYVYKQYDGMEDEISNHYAVNITTADSGIVSLVYADVTNLAGNWRMPNRITYAYGCTFRSTTNGYIRCRYLNSSTGQVQEDSYQIHPGYITKAENCIFYKLNSGSNDDLYCTAKSCIFVDCSLSLDNLNAQDCLFLGNRSVYSSSGERWNDETGRYEPYTSYGFNSPSTYTAPSFYNSFDAYDNIHILYRQETGTTYIAYNGSYNEQQLALYVNKIHGDYPELGVKLEDMTGHYAIIETTDELNWLNRYGYAFATDLTYDFVQKCYTWSDGTPIGDFLAVDGVTNTYSGKELYLSNGALSTGYSGSLYRLYEFPGPIYVTDIRLSEYNVLVDMASTYQIKFSTTPGNVAPEDLIFESDNEAVATVDEFGMVTPVSEGDANIYVYCGDRAVRNHVTIHVREYRALESLSFKQESAEVAIGNTCETGLIYTPVNTTRKNVTYTSSDPAIATVDYQGRVKGISSGKVTITATSSEVDADGNPITASMEFTVYRETTGMTLSTDTLLASQYSFVELPQLTLTPADAEPILNWRSTDPDVVSFDEEGNLVTGTPGTTTIVAEDLRTGLYASFLLIVIEEEELPKIKDIQFYDTYHHVLMENGDLYFWSANHEVPELILEGVEMFDQDGSDLIAVMMDGSQLLYDHGSIYPISYGSSPALDNLVDIQFKADYPRTGYALTADGYVYFTPDGNFVTASSELLNLENVVQMSIQRNYSLFLTENGDLYYAETNNNTPFVEPIATNVSHVTESAYSYESSFYYLKNDGSNWCFNPTGSHYQSGDRAPSGMDEVFTYTWRTYGIKDGNIYEYSDGSTKLFAELGNVTKIFMIDDMAYAITSEGMLYGWGRNDYGNFLGATDEPNVEKPILIPLFNVEKNFRLTDSNLIDNQVLIDDKLELEFSNKLNSVSVKLTANGTPVPVTPILHDENRMTVSISGGFQDDTTYVLTFPAGSIKAAYGVTNAYDISITFTTEFYQTNKILEVDVTAEGSAMDVLNVHDWSELELEYYITDETILTINEENQMVPQYPGVTTVRLTENRSGFSCEFDVVVYETVLEEVTDEATGETTEVPVKVIPEEVMVLESLNLVNPDSEEAALCEPQLVMNFNKRVLAQTVQIYYVDENGEWIELEEEILTETDLDQVTAMPASGFVEDKDYIVFLSGTYFEGLNAAPSQWVVSYQFKYDPIEIIDTSIVRDSILDPTVERFYWNSEYFKEVVNEKHSALKLNYRFLNNVLLNRITTDTDVDNWLRIMAPEGDGSYIPFGGNYWGTVDEKAISLQVLDHNDFSTYATIEYQPYLTTAPETTFPFVTGLKILNKAGNEVYHLSNETITVRITFNRDMDTTVPLDVSFGNNYPYNQYVIYGEYVDARTWEGNYILTTILPNGNHCFSIGGGRSAEGGLELFTDWGRFGFELDTAAAQALLMQGEANAEGIQLSWSQDDFDTLMGYNVYRATGDPNAYAQRINTTIIPAGTEEFLDTTVEPGVLYYYNFTVVQTDLSESVPSGKISVMSLDTMAPDLYHTPIYNATTGSNLVISATVKDNVSVGSVSVFYRTVGQNDWNTAVMNKLNDKYTALISADQLTTDGLEYYIEASDGISVSSKGSAENPYVITITSAQDTTSKGDVNGDGKINALDALMLLQSINGLLNLTSEQFARADLDGNGILQAMEALRILDFITGKVGSVLMN